MIQTADEFIDDRDEKTRALYVAAYKAQQEDQVDDVGLQSIRDSLTGCTVYNAIGAGGQGRVYSGFLESTQQSVAIKVLHGGPFSSRRETRRLWREIAILRRLKHPGIVNIYDSGTINGAPYLVMERIIGVQIDCIAITAGLNLPQRIELFLQACGAVSAAHAEGIIHRDLKPANILVESVFDDDDDDKEEMYVRLLDFGLAKDLSESPDASSSNLSITGCRVGTARYSSPEQIRGRQVGVQTDIYSLGVVLFELLSGQLPYIQNDQEYGDVALVMHGRRRGLRDAIKTTNVIDSALCPYSPKEVGRDLETILDTATAAEPDLRYGTVDEFADDLRRYLDGKNINAQISVGRRIRARAIAYRRKLAAAAVIALIVTLSLVAVIARQKSQEAERASHAIIGVAAFVRMAERHTHASEFDRAKATLLEAVALSEAIPPLDSEGYRPVYTAYHDLADLAFRSNDLDTARNYSQQAIDIVDTMRREFPSDQLWFRLEGFSHKLRGRIAYEEKDWSTALGHFERMLEVRDELLSNAPSLVGHQIEVVNGCSWVGNAARHNGQQDYAIDILRRAITIGTNIVDQHPDEVEHVVRLAHAESDLGAALMSDGIHEDRALAAKWFTVARSRLLSAQDAGGLGKWQTTASGRLALIERNLGIINKKKH